MKGLIIMSLPQEYTFTIDDIYALPEGKRAELIDGRMYMMAPPNRRHQKLISELHYKIRDYIHQKQGLCEIYPAPFAVLLNKDDRNYVEPDIAVICDPNKLTDKGCVGAPDWIIEVVSPSSQQMDYGIKLFKYRTAGVREYWIVNPMKNTITVFDFDQEEHSGQYSFEDDISVCIYEDLIINLSNI